MKRTLKYLLIACLTLSIPLYGSAQDVKTKKDMTVKDFTPKEVTKEAKSVKAQDNETATSGQVPKGQLTKDKITGVSSKPKAKSAAGKKSKAEVEGAKPAAGKDPISQSAKTQGKIIQKKAELKNK